MGLQIIKTFDENTKSWIVRPIGEVDIYTSPELKTQLLDMIKERFEDITIDGEGLEYIDSTGLGVLISALKKIKEEEKHITIINIKPSIKKLFDLTGLNKVFIVKE